MDNFFQKLGTLFLTLLLLVAVSGTLQASAPVVEKDLAPLPAASPSENTKTNTATEAPAALAKDDFSHGFKSIGRGFKYGAEATGHGVTTAAKSVGGAFKKAGLAIKNLFTGKKSDESQKVEERDIGSNARPELEEKLEKNRELDAVGNEPFKKGEAQKGKNLVKNNDNDEAPANF